jgi:RING finger and CHY zinc finger domain-containing protein 1
MSNNLLEELCIKEDNNICEKEEEGVNECNHYNRLCYIVAECCNKIYSCRLCHDLEMYEQEKDIKKKHKLDRFKIKEVVCKLCNTKQDKSNNCINCNINFGSYYCNICNLYDYNDRGQYHCSKCGICRVGGKEHFVHCDTCNMCIKKDLSDHKCISNKSDNDCPICMEYLFDSVKEINILKCGHVIHKDCLLEYSKYNYKCPLCNKSMFNMENYFNILENEINTVSIPEEFRKKVDILCNDCGDRSNIDFHFAGLKCNNCNSFNTQII